VAIANKNASAALLGLDERVVAWRGVRLRLFTGGVGRPLLLLHGEGGSALSFATCLPLLLPGRRLLIPDLPAHGGSDPLPDAPSNAGAADLLAAVCAHEGVGEVDVFGHSLGGAIGLRLALRHLSLVRRLVVAAPTHCELPAPACAVPDHPLLVLWGARDAERPLGEGVALARRLAAPLRVIAGCGHSLPVERPDVCATVVREFL
jgi:pimeloyl-ACP methyl ester carboxylesterase